MKENLNLHRRTAFACVLFLSAMFGLSYAAVPFYSWFCARTGFGGTPQVAQKAPASAVDKTINVRFDSNMASDLPWRFGPKQREMKVRLGEVVTATYMAENLSNQTSVGTATYNVTPELAGGYFNKLECFCFTQQTLKPHEKREFSVSFFVDPEVVKDRGLSTLDTITLSYTFYPNQARVSQLGR
jgi:cytochrome c oxidase assembly protein subunit 11